MPARENGLLRKLMKSECEHSWYAPSKILRRCSRCDKEVKVLVFSHDSYSQKEFRKMYPISRSVGEIIMDDEPSI